MHALVYNFRQFFIVNISDILNIINQSPQSEELWKLFLLSQRGWEIGLKKKKKIKTNLGIAKMNHQENINKENMDGLSEH